jgi:hypothetical protein
MWRRRERAYTKPNSIGSKGNCCSSLESRGQRSGPVYRGWALAEQGQVEEGFHKALDIARSQSAKSLELRAATSLARLWQQQGKITEAHDLLAPVYNWFTEGFNMADLQDAKALLQELT